MSERSGEFITGIIIGALTVLFIQVSILLFGLRKMVKKKRYPDLYHRDMLEDPPEALVKLLGIATQECNDLAWLNISLQRFFLELTKSSTFYEKVKETLVKKLSIAFSSGILKRVRFKDVSFGSEAPYLKKIRALSEAEIEELFRRKDTDKDLGESSNKPAAFKQIYLLIDMEYTADDNCIYIDADLIKGYSIPIMVKLQPFKGQMILRLPANNYSTRFEICFIKNPGFDFSVEASFSKNDSVFFSSSVSSLLKRLCKYIMKMYIFPNWYYYYLPMVVSRSKVIVYTYYSIVDNKIDGPMHQVREIQNLFSLDFSILSKKENIIFRRTKSTVNSSGVPLEKAEIEIPEEKLPAINELFKNPDKFDIFTDVISDYEGEKVIETYADNVKKVHLVIGGNIYEFIRISVEDLLIFQLTDPAEPQFIAVRKELYSITIMQYAQKEALFYLSKFRITKLAKKLEQQQMKVLGSTKLFKIFDYSIKQAEKAKKILNKPKTKPEKAKSIPLKDPSKMQYISDGYNIDSTSIPQTTISEVSIIESHFRSIETRLENEDKQPDLELLLPYTNEQIVEALDQSILRASILGLFVIMEDISLTDTIRSTSMSHDPSGQYVQLLSYYSKNNKYLIERILLSEEFQGITLAMRIIDNRIDIFIYGNITLKIEEFKGVLQTYIEREIVLKEERLEIPRTYSTIIEDCAGIVLSSSAPISCEVKIERGPLVFQGTVILKTPFISMMYLPGEDQEHYQMKINIRTKKKHPLYLYEIPTENKDMIYTEGHFVSRRKDKIIFPAGTGVTHWCSPWTITDKNKMEDNTINGSSTVIATTPTPLIWMNREGKNQSEYLSVGSIIPTI
ncbi:hypothetical protein NEOKW01_2092 [Nematocida sp. AWRm80]|nr:hypothetical protein NEOKW01_2092 [Nematocida sp. AWRm80]